MLTRRRLLEAAAGIGGAGALAAVAVPGARHRLHDLVDPAPVSPHPVPRGPVGELVSGSFASAAMGFVVGCSIAYPTTVQRELPFLLVLHGRGNDHRSAFSAHLLRRFLSDAVRRGVPPFAVVAVDGGSDSYWHRRRSGMDPQRMILSELLPVLVGRGLYTDRFAVGGWSMGGYGALLLAERLGAERIAAVVPDSPALWERWKDAAAGAFDGPGDFADHDVLALTDRLRGIPVRVTCGTSDPLLPGVKAFLRRFPAAQRELGPGGHDDAWWQHTAPAQLAFAGRALSLG
ncbi:MAG TPA: alpha/beta hydrolase-fold protein [Mycobacteriales bacterium]|nr:alpha/beta hydrolase-fold protein [Mycobacteriales bacterium]